MKTSPHISRFQLPIALALILIGLWPVVVWWTERALDASDEPWGLGAVFILFVFGFLDRRTTDAAPKTYRAYLEVSVLVLYALTFSFVPNLVRGIFAAVIIGAVISKARGTGSAHFATWGLVGMTLPWLASLQFFLGYPLRWITTQCTRMLLNLSGLPVASDGLSLVWGPISVWVDGPCSGVRMLWVGVFLSFALAFVFRLKNWATCLLVLVGLGATIAGNVSRASAVFYLEADIVIAPGVFHELAGVVAFIVICVLVVAMAFALKKQSLRAVPASLPRLSRMFFLVLLIAALAPFFAPASDGSQTDFAFPGFPQSLDGAVMNTRKLSERDLPYLKGFPGKIAGFQTAEHVILLRWVHSPTRRLHSAADCYRGLGYEVSPMTGDRNWARFRAQKDGEEITFEERIVDGRGEVFLDVGAWYWSAMLGRTTGPWWNQVRVVR